MGRLLLLALGVVAPVSLVQALKIDTHIYVAQEVINDVVDDGRVSIVIGGITHRFPVDEEVVRSIGNYPSHFRMGSVGPDAFPGIIGGQNVIHPGDELLTGWGTGEWLHYVSSTAARPEEIAFSAGFKVHAASDAFAHTYVNHYSGNVWNLFDETHVEARHFILESFIASKNPPIRDHLGTPLGTASQVIHDASGRLAIPAEFIASSMIFSPTSRRFENGAPHLAFLGKHEQNIANAVADAEKIAVEIERAALSLRTGIDLNQRDIKRLRDLANKLRNDLMPIDEIKKIADEITDLRKLHAQIPADVLEKALEALVKAYSEYAKARGKVEEAALKVADLSDRIRAAISACRATKRLVSGHCEGRERICRALPWPTSEVCGWHTKLDPTCLAQATRLYEEALAACERFEEVTVLRGLLSAAIDAHRALEQEALGLKDAVVKIANEIENLVIVQIELQNQFLQAGLDLVRLAIADFNPVLAFLKSWHQGIRRAGATYVEANGQAMANAITPGRDPIEPLMQWLECNTYPIAGVPHPLSDAACSLDGAKSEALASLKRILETLGEVNPISRELLRLIESLERKVSEVVTEGIVTALQEVTGAPVKELLRIIKEPGTVESVTRVFTSGEQHNLRSIPDAAYRVGAEMGLSPDNPYFDLDRFNVVYNAIVLSKLSLLSVAQLNELARIAGVEGDTSYGPTLFDDASPKAADVLVGGLRSIDGSHQWFGRAMPFLRTWGHEHAPLGRYTYLRADGAANGFRLWQDEGARDRVFRRVFRGPLVPGIDAPDTIGFPPVLLANYPYRVCHEHPWPNENDHDAPDVIVDETCPRPALAEMLSAYPDLTREVAATMKATHALLAPKNMPTEILTSGSAWICISPARDGHGIHVWGLQFRTDGRLSGTVSYRSIDNPEKAAVSAAVNAAYELIGDFLFTTPVGAGYLELATPDAPEPTLLRRLTNHPQRYWVDRSSEVHLALTNQDGTQLLCKSELEMVEGADPTPPQF